MSPGALLRGLACRKTLRVFPTKGLWSAARIICPSVTDKFHTGSPSCIFSHAHVGAWSPPAGGQGGKSPGRRQGARTQGASSRPGQCAHLAGPMGCLKRTAAAPPGPGRSSAASSLFRCWLLFTASRPPHRPPLNSVAAVRAAAIPGRRTLNAAGAGQGLGSPASADARPAGGREAEGRFAPPLQTRAERGGPAGRSSSLSPYTVAAVTFGEKKAQTGLKTGTIPPLVLHRGRTHIPRRPAPCRPLPWRVGGAAPPR